MTSGGLERFTPAGAPARALDVREMMRRAEVISKTDLVPKALQGKPDAVVLVGMYGAELGFSFIESMQCIDIIENRPSPNAQARLKLIRQHGHEARFVQTTEQEAVIRGRRREDRDDPNAWIEARYSIEKARRAGLTDTWVERWVPTQTGRKRPERVVVGDDRGIDSDRVAKAPDWARALVDKGELKYKDNWRRFPEEMLRARATTTLFSMHFSDVLSGAHPLTFDEFDDDSGARAEGAAEVQPGSNDPTAGAPSATDDEVEDAELVEDAP